MQNKLGGLDSASRDAALSTIFGSDAMRAATVMMDSGTEGIQKYINAANDQEAAQRLANSQMSDGSRAIEELKGSLETAAIQIGDTLAPIVQKVAELITALVNIFSTTGRRATGDCSSRNSGCSIRTTTDGNRPDITRDICGGRSTVEVVWKRGSCRQSWSTELKQR